MAAQQFSNNFTTTLNGPITSGATSLVVNSATGSPASAPFTIMTCVYNPATPQTPPTNVEIMLVTAGAGTTTWTVTRGQEGTAAVSHANGEFVAQIWSVAGLQSLNQGFWPYLQPSGLTGATNPTRYVGGTTSGAPTSGGPFVAGDFVIDATGAVYVCTSGGSPGTWLPASIRNPYRARMYLASTSTLLASGTWTNLNFDTTDYDHSPGSAMATNGANAHMTAPITGTYSIEVTWQIPSATGATRVVCDISTSPFTAGYSNNGLVRLSDDAKVGVANANYTAGGIVKLDLTAGTSIYVGALQTSAGVNFNGGTAVQTCWVEMSLVGA